MGRMILAEVYDKGKYSNQHANPTVFVFMINATISLSEGEFEATENTTG